MDFSLISLSVYFLIDTVNLLIDSMENLQIITPDHPEFGYWLAQPPPTYNKECEQKGEGLNFIMDSETGIFKTATQSELTEYLEGGEYYEVAGDLLNGLD